MRFIDKTILELLSFLITCVGIFGILLKDSAAPETKMSFFGANPFAYKHDIIDSYITWYFGAIALIGIVFQAFVLLFGNTIQNHQYSVRTYFIFFVMSLGLSAPASKIVSIIAKKFARPEWLPAIVKMQRGLYDRTQDILSNNGLRSDQVKVSQELSEQQISKYKDANSEIVKKDLDQIENLLELNVIHAEPTIRLNRLTPFFEKYPGHYPE